MPSGPLGGVCPACVFEQMLGSPPDGAAGEELPLEDTPDTGTTISYIGDYELIEIVAQGGMGVVYKALQRSLNRLVALKLLLGGAHARADYKRRFRQEAELAAMLQHPNIVPIYEVGEHEGQPYFSMEYVAGSDLEKLTRQHPLAPRQAAEYVRTLAEAVHYAHQQGVLHRDLKPSNILVGLDGRPRITDFGLARQTDADSSLTSIGAVLGTPGFLPPEQASSKYGAAGPWSDIYALGALLFHLLTGRPPFLAATITETVQQVLESDPVAPRRLNAAVDRDLETICLKCLEKEPRRRYQDGGDLAEDLGRWLTGEPIRARPVTAIARVWKWIRRRPAQAGLSLSLAAVIGLASTAAVLQTARQRANMRAANLAAGIWLDRAETELDRGEPLAGLRHMASSVETAPFSRVAVTRLLWALSYRNYLLPALCLQDASDSRLVAARFTPDGRSVVTVAYGADLKAWDAGTGRPTSPVHTNRSALQFNALLLSPDGKLSLTLGALNFMQGFARLTPLDGAPAYSLWVTNALGGFDQGQFTADGRGVWLVTTEPFRNATLYETATGRRLRQILPREAGEALALNQRAVALSHHGTLFACAGSQSNVWIYETGTGQLSKMLSTTEPLKALDFDHDGNHLLGASGNGRVRVWDWRSERVVSESPGWGPAEMARISPDGSRVLLFTTKDSLLLKAAHLATPIQSYPPSKLLDVSPFSPDSKHFVLCKDSQVRVWDSETGGPFAEPSGQGSLVEDVAFSPDGRRLVSGVFELAGDHL